ncbi:MAG: acetoacetate metabolism regulatory protein AtoC, partial [Myxococcaceae bacterium]|nr:acetoacetate metabolism regulatory protein AtoC [Myxococcaceae bacterium]
PPAGGPLRGELEALERQRIVDALERCAGNQTQAAAQLGMPRRTLVAKLVAHNIPRPRKRD